MNGPDPGRRPPLSRGQAVEARPKTGSQPQGDGTDAAQVPELLLPPPDTIGLFCRDTQARREAK
jgi:hypothetical protein